MSDDIAEFLRRAAQRYPHAQRPMQPIVIEAEVVEDAEILDTGDTPGQDVVQHVQQHMDTSGFSRRASSLGATVDQSDDRMDAHVHEIFAYDLGQLTSRAGGPAPSRPEPSAAAAPETRPDVAAGGTPISELLKNPRQLRNALLLSEILQRPERLW